MLAENKNEHVTENVLVGKYVDWCIDCSLFNTINVALFKCISYIITQSVPFNFLL